MDDHHFDHITKSYKETLVLTPYQMVHMECQQKKSMVLLNQAFGILANGISYNFICHIYIIIAPECMFFLTFLFFIVILMSCKVPNGIRNFSIYWDLTFIIAL
jgi:hypothetical protein